MSLEERFQQVVEEYDNETRQFKGLLELFQEIVSWFFSQFTSEPKTFSCYNRFFDKPELKATVDETKSLLAPNRLK